MNLDKKLSNLPLTKTNPDTLSSLFGDADIIPMWVADMEFEIDTSIQKALMDRISKSGFGYEYKPESFFEAQRKWYKNHYDLDLKQEHTLYSPSITTSVAVIIENFTSEKDGIIIQPPVFMEFKDVIRTTKRRIIKNALKIVNGHYKIDFEDLENKAQSENNKILILCNPHNPVGRVWKREELKKIVSICKQNDILIISDEIHKDIILFDNQFTSLLHFVNSWNKIIVCTSEAKTFNIPAISDSMVIIENENLRNSVKHTFKKFNLGRTNALTRVALETAYLNSDSWLKELISTIESNVNLIEKELKNSNSKIGMMKPEGTYQVWLDFRGIFTDTKEMFHQVTERSGIGINAGHWFGREGALFMRMNIATSKEKVQYAIRQIIKSVL
jgi:putative C-S lyase